MPRFSLPASWRARATECGLARMLRQGSLSWSTPPMRKPAALHMFFDPGRRAELRGDRTSTRSVDQSCLPNRSYPPEGPCFKFRDSGRARRCAAHNGTRRNPRRFAPSAGNARNRTSQARAIWESSLLRSEQRLRRPWGLPPLFSVQPRRCATRIPRKRYRGWVEVYTRRFCCVHGHRARSASPDGSESAATSRPSLVDRP
jgi:hypothetical protein